MSALTVNVPFPVFNDRDGDPLENGYIWIGEPNLSPPANPVAVYFDEALTIPAAQPLRTIGGYVSRSGSPAQLYVNGTSFSLLVQDKKGTQVYNFPLVTGQSLSASTVAYVPSVSSLMAPLVPLSVNSALDAITNSDQGSAYVGFKQAGTDSVSRTVRAELRDTVKAVQFAGVDPTGTTDSTTGLQNALATGKVVYLQEGIFLVSAALLLSAEGQRLVGDGANKTTILVSGSGYDVVSLSANFSGVSGLRFLSNTQRTSGSFVKLPNPTRGNFVSDFLMQNGHFGIHIAAESVITYIEQGQILDATATTGVGILIEGGNDTFISKIVMDSSGTEPESGIKVTRSQAVWISDVDVLDFGTPLKFAANGPTGLVTWCFISQFAADNSNGNGIEITAANGGVIKGLFFTNSWSATNGRGLYVATATGGVVDTVRFNGALYNNQTHGALIDSSGGNVSGITIHDSNVAGNSLASPGTYAGIEFGNGGISFSVSGTRSGAHALFANTQSYGLLIGTGCENYIVTGNNFAGNVVAGVVDNSLITSSVREVNSNVGYVTEKTGIATIVAGQNAVLVTHGLSGRPQNVVVSPVNTNLAGLAFWSGSFLPADFSLNVSANTPSNAVFAWTAKIY